MNIDELSGAELDNLAATSGMGWHLDSLIGWWLDKDNVYMESGRRWHPSRGKKLNPAASDVLLKALGDGLTVELMLNGDPNPARYLVNIPDAPGHIGHNIMANAPTLPLALVRAICKAVAK